MSGSATTCGTAGRTFYRRDQQYSLPTLPANQAERWRRYAPRLINSGLGTYPSIDLSDDQASASMKANSEAVVVKRRYRRELRPHRTG